MANILTILRILLIMPFVACLYFAPVNRDLLITGALVIFVVAGLTDFLDGYIARKTNTTSLLGAALDPIADKLLTIAALVMLIWTGLISGVFMLCALAIISREVFVSGLREATVHIPEAKNAVKVSILAKWKTATQFVAIAAYLVRYSEILWISQQFLANSFLVMATILSIITGAIYLRNLWPFLTRP